MLATSLVVREVVTSEGFSSIRCAIRCLRTPTTASAASATIGPYIDDTFEHLGIREADGSAPTRIVRNPVPFDHAAFATPRAPQLIRTC